MLGALHELLRGLDSAEPALIRELATSRPDHLYEGLLTVLMRLVFVLYAEDRDLLPSRSDGRAREIYETSYSVRGLYAKLTRTPTLNPDTMDERRGGWGGLLALFRLIHKGHRTHFVQARGGKLFDPDEFPFLEGRASKDEPARILTVSDGCLLRILEGLMTLKLRGGSASACPTGPSMSNRSARSTRPSWASRSRPPQSRVLAIKAGKNNKTPVFVALDELLAKKGKDRIKDLKENAGRGALTAAQAKAVEDAQERRGSRGGARRHRRRARLAQEEDRGIAARRSCSRPANGGGPAATTRRASLTAPIVKYALEPAFDRLGPDATPDQVLDLKVCDPAMGSGAFLVEACRAIGERLVAAWARWPETRPKIPADEDEELHARRLVAQRCLYGVDKNPRAVDLARLSLWLATLARDHEFTFLDHALKCGDSLVGLTTAQIAAANWDESKPGLPLFRQLVKDSVAKAMTARAEIQAAPDDTLRAIQEARHRRSRIRSLARSALMGDAVISAFFAADKPKAREKDASRGRELASRACSPQHGKCSKLRRHRCASGEHPIPPFHWEIEFPEVFARENGGFDAIVGNPPFAGQDTDHRQQCQELPALAANAASRVRMAMPILSRISSAAPLTLLRSGGVFGLIATNTIGQGDTRASGLTQILRNGGAILRATRRLKWPGEAAVVVSVVHVAKGAAALPVLDRRHGPPHLGLSGRGRSRYFAHERWSPIPARRFRDLCCSAWASPSTMRRGKRRGGKPRHDASADRQRPAQCGADLSHISVAKRSTTSPTMRIIGM